MLSYFRYSIHFHLLHHFRQKFVKNFNYTYTKHLSMTRESRIWSIKRASTSYAIQLLQGKRREFFADGNREINK